MNKGKIISKHGSSISLTIVFSFLALLIAGAGALLLNVMRNPGDLRFEGDPALVINIGYAAIAIGILIELGTAWSLSRQPKFTLFEHAIHARSGKIDRLDAYADIEDIYTFLYGGAGYRTHGGQWVFSGGRTSRLGTMTRNLIELQVKHRLPKLMDELRAGGTVTFQYLDERTAAAKSLVASRNLNYPTKPLKVSMNALEIEGRSIPVSELAAIRENPWTESMKLIDRSGKIFFKTHMSAIYSLDLLYRLLMQVQEEKMAERAG